MIFDALVAGYIRQNALRASVTIVAIAVGVAAVLAGDLARASADAALRASVAGLSERANLQVLGFGTRLDERLLARVRTVRGVEQARPVVRGAAALGDAAVGSRNGDVIMIEGVDALQAFPGSGALRTFESGPFAPPSELDTSLVARRGAVISERLAGNFHLRPGSRFVVRAAGRAATLEVAAVLPRQPPGLDSETVLVDVTTAQTLFGAAGQLDRIDVIAAAPAVEGVRARLAAALGRQALVIATADRITALELAARGFELDLIVLAAVVLLVGATLVANALGISVAQRRPQIGTLRALGATRGQIVRAFLSEGALLGAGGALLGAILGDALARGAGTLLGGADLLIVLRDAGLGVAVAIAAAVAPSLEAAATLPANALRVVPVATTRGFSILRRFGVPFGLASTARAVLRRADGLPPRVRLACANLHAAAGRLSVALGALIIAVAASTCVATATNSFHAAVAAWVQRSIIGDLAIRPLAIADTRFSARVQARIARLPGVAAVFTLRRAEVPFEGTFIALEAVDERTLAARNLSLAPGEAIVSHGAARRFRLRPGDRMTFDTPAGRTTLRVRQLEDDMRSDAGGTVTLAEPTYARLFGDTTVDAIAIVARRGTALGPLRSRLAAAAAPLPVEVAPVREQRALALASFDRPFALTYALALVSIAVAILGTSVTMLALVFERRREFGILRVLGLPARALRVMIVCEASAVAALAASCGALTGIALGALLVAVDRHRFGWSIALHVPAASVVLTVLLVVVIAAFAALVPARRAALAAPAGAMLAE
ncbi:MAG: ABC transporter permease [Candidatus Eremiobacteraeota bacterium]|nr:ABC transporter permease [Candidatus Eremiobacteraeota bacterium]MBC5801694.1 ABC transporter permease [Candidatus Eremiobacteraeota bacterium]MBC5821258.1 ABC transporter permease [Candidatus Eremiobacteraeota bacterium]